MPSRQHEFPLDLIRNDPASVVELLKEITGKPLPEFTRVEALLGFLEAREIKVSEAARERITGTTDIAVLDAMLRKAAHVERVEDLFGK